MTKVRVKYGDSDDPRALTYSKYADADEVIEEAMQMVPDHHEIIETEVLQHH